MGQVDWTPVGRRDLKEIAKYIARQGQRPAIAAKVVDEIHARCAEYALRLDVGSRHKYFPDPMRFFVHKWYVIIYEPTDDGLIVHRVVDGARDLSRLFP